MWRPKVAVHSQLSHFKSFSLFRIVVWCVSRLVLSVFRLVNGAGEGRRPEGVH